MRRSSIPRLMLWNEPLPYIAPSGSDVELLPELLPLPLDDEEDDEGESHMTREAPREFN